MTGLQDQSYGILLNQIGNALITPVTRMQQIPRGHIMQLMTRIYIVTIFVFTIHLYICVVFVFVIVLWADCAPNPHERALNWPLRQWSILAGLLNWSMLLCYYIALSIKKTLMYYNMIIMMFLCWYTSIYGFYWNLRTLWVQVPCIIREISLHCELYWWCYTTVVYSY